MLSNEDLLHLSSYLITGCLFLLLSFVVAAVSIRCCTKRLKRRRGFLEPEMTAQDWQSYEQSLLENMEAEFDSGEVDFQDRLPATTAAATGCVECQFNEKCGGGGGQPHKGCKLGLGGGGVEVPEDDHQRRPAKNTWLLKAQRILDGFGDRILTGFNTKLISLPDQENTTSRPPPPTLMPHQTSSVRTPEQEVVEHRHIIRNWERKAEDEEEVGELDEREAAAAAAAVTMAAADLTAAAADDDFFYLPAVAAAPVIPSVCARLSERH